ncbi:MULTISPECIES: type VI secretion system protein TssL, long form [unclassified Caballeronia]|uniref:type VI secretion system protein TssL, long form n=1 Tax=unclassified Caballeronia TaxID=2646786 RepID=UPI00202991D5|nr:MULTISPECIES: type VI secretion system protein TssL, long form [unclassified Caballeronia]MDR5767875.1 type VI secretion system protein TssL, long form [Caballeronia sp. LZ028]
MDDAYLTSKPNWHEEPTFGGDQAQSKDDERLDEALTAEYIKRIPPGEPASARLCAIEQATNPLLEASRPLLRALAEIPDTLTSIQITTLHALLKEEVRAFQRLCEQANVRREHMLGARYCLCTALDEAAMQTTWGKRESGVAWIRDGLATEFHEDRQGGVKIYLLIGRLLSQPHEHHDLLEVIFRVLSLGFMGRFAHEADGARKHDAIRQRLYHEIQAHRKPLAVALSPHASSDARGERLSVYDFPVWISFTLLGVVLLGLFGWFKYQLLSDGASVEKLIVDIGKMTPPPAPRLPRLRELLKEEITAGTVSVDEDASHSGVTFRGDAMFAPGGITVHSSMAPLIAKIAREVVKVPGKVTVTGYTDSVPVTSRQFTSNDALSLERATQVMQMLQASGIPANRLEAVGRGAADPVGDNATAQGRALNRRVSINVTP